jgi:uncharacterized protein
MTLNFIHWESHMFLKQVLVIIILLMISGCNMDSQAQKTAVNAVAQATAERHDIIPPKINKWTKRPTVLVFSKTNAWRHHEGIAAADLHFVRLAKQFGFGVYTTENGAIFNDEDLKTFNVIVFNSATGDMLSKAQELAFQRWLTNGGGWIGLHGSGDNSQQDWPWYQSNLIGPKFIGHPNKPHLQNARVVNLNKRHPVMAGIPNDWTAFDEWYSFDGVPQTFGLNVLAGLDESTYKAMIDENEFPEKGDLRMGPSPEQHPVIWTTCIGQGRAFYSALGHHDRVYEDETYQTILHNAMSWVSKKVGENNVGCL